MVNEVIHPNPSQIVPPIGNQKLKYMSPKGHSQSTTPVNKVKIRKIMVTSVFLDEASRSKMMLIRIGETDSNRFIGTRCEARLLLTFVMSSQYIRKELLCSVISNAGAEAVSENE